MAAQEERIRAYAQLRALEIGEVLVDAGVSGSVPLGQRPAGRRLAAALRRHGATHIVGLKLDRLFRDASDALTQTKAWDRDGIALHLCDMGGGAIDTSSPMGRMLLTTLAGFAEFERNLIAERTKAALAHKRAHGEWTGGQTPYGTRAEAGRVVPDGREEAIIAEARRLHADGLSLRAVAAELLAAGMVSRASKPFGPAQIKGMLA